MFHFLCYLVFLVGHRVPWRIFAFPFITCLLHSSLISFSNFLLPLFPGPQATFSPRPYLHLLLLPIRLSLKHFLNTARFFLSFSCTLSYPFPALLLTTMFISVQKKKSLQLLHYFSLLLLPPSHLMAP